MTNIQAINLLKGLEQSLDDYCELNEEGKTAFRMAIEALNCSEFPNNSDTISRQAAIDAIQNEVEPFAIVEPGTTCVIGAGVKDADVIRTIEQLPSAQPEEAIQVSWIEARIKRFKAEDNAFCGLTANIMHVMLNEWKREQEGETE